MNYVRWLQPVGRKAFNLAHRARKRPLGTPRKKRAKSNGRAVKENAMSDYRKLHLMMFLAALVALLFSPLARAEEQPKAQPVAVQTESSTPSAPSPVPQAAAATDPNNDVWHFAVAPYLWFAGMHGTVGARGYDASVHAS